MNFTQTKKKNLCALLLHIILNDSKGNKTKTGTTATTTTTKKKNICCNFNSDISCITIFFFLLGTFHSLSINRTMINCDCAQLFIIIKIFNNNKSSLLVEFSVSKSNENTKYYFLL